MDDKRILEQLWARDEHAIEALRRRFGPRLLATAMNILSSRQDAEETVSDTYLAVWNAVPPGRPEPLAGFVYKIGRNLALKRLRRNTAQKRRGDYEASLEELAGCIPGPALEEAVEARALGRSIDKFLSGLSRENRCVFLRRYWFGDTAREIGSALGMNENAVNVRLSRIRAQLKEYLIQEGFYHA